MQLPKLFAKSKNKRDNAVVATNRDVLRVSNYLPRETKQKRFNLFSRKDRPATQVVRPQFGKDIRKQRQTRQQLNLLRNIGGFLGQHRKQLFILIGILIVAVIFGGGFYLINSKKAIALEKIVVSGNDQVKAEEIEALLQPYIGRSLLSFSSGEIEAKILAAFPYIKTAYARKILPKEVDIEIDERYPVFSFVNQSGVFLVDSDGRVILNYDVNAIPALSSDDILVMEGYGDFNADYTKERYLAGISDATERAKVKWEEVPQEDKVQALDDLRQDLLSRTEAKIAAHKAVLDASKFKDVPVITSWDSSSFNPGDTFSTIKFTTLSQMLAYAQKDAKNKFTEILWQSDFSIVYRLAVGPGLIFTTNRPLADQLLALDTLRGVRDITELQVMDLRSEVIAVR